MKAVVDNTYELIIKKSRFIAVICQIDQQKEIDDKLKEIKKQYPDATHYCYAYIVDNTIKASDDGEPSGTAGLPILNVLKKENLNHVLCIVIRYFGGTKLGAGGLIRAYSNVTKKSIITKELQEGLLLKIEFDYQKTKEIDYLLNKSNVIKKDFQSNPIYEVEITTRDFDKIEKALRQISKITILKNIYMKWGNIWNFWNT